MVSIPKIKIGKGFRKNRLNLDHDVNTTSNFGFMQPTLFHEVIADSDVSLNTNQFVRFGIMPTPSFARISAKTVTSFVPISDVFEAYENMVSQIPYKTSTGLTAVAPDRADYITARNLFSFLMSMCVRSRGTSFTTAQDPFVEDIPFIPVIFDNGKPLGYTTVNNLNNFSDYNYLLEDIAFATRDGSYITGNQWLACGTVLAGGEPPLSPAGAFHLPPSLSIYKGKVSFESCDFCLHSDDPDQNDRFLCFYATKSGRDMLKILNGLGITFADPDKMIPMTAFYAFYKVWFDAFNPGRDTSWRQTRAYKLIHRYYDYPNLSTNELVEDGSFNSLILKDGSSATPFYYDDFEFFFRDLLRCYYTESPDIFTCCLADLNVGAGDSTSYISSSSRTDVDDITYGKDTVSYAHLFNSEDGVTSSNVPSAGNVNALSVKLMQRLLPFMNKNSVIGARIHEYMATHYGVRMPKRNYMKFDSYSIDIEPVFSTSQNETSKLGEYAGRAAGGGRSNGIKFHCDEAGFVIQLFGMVPNGGYSQGYGNSLRVMRHEFYNSMYDSVGMAAVRQADIFGTYYDFANRYSTLAQSMFGFRPRFSDYKYHNNVRSGDFNRRSTYKYLMSYCMDKFFSQDIYDSKGNLSSEAVSECVSENLRYIGFDEAYGNYDRLFEENLGLNDNFIVHMIQNFNVTSPMLALSESFDTFTEDVNTKADVVEHS